MEVDTAVLPPVVGYLLASAPLPRYNAGGAEGRGKEMAAIAYLLPFFEVHTVVLRLLGRDGVDASIVSVGNRWG